MNIFILDACALIAFLSGEKGAEKVRDILQNALDGKIVLKISQINLLEVYYDAINVYDQSIADEILEKINEFPIEVIIGLSKDVFKEAGRIKSKYRIPLGDSVAVAECIVGNGILVTADHADFEKIENAENIEINWGR